MSKNTGGPAFPNITPDMPVDGTPGMTLRDYFAAKAMQGQLSYGDCADMSAAGVAKFAYEVADAMLAERENQS